MEQRKAVNENAELSELEEEDLEKVSGGMICPGTVPPKKNDEEDKPAIERGGATGGW